MDLDPDWPILVLLREYKRALTTFEQASSALTAALVDRDTSVDDLPPLFAAESTARDAVVLSRMRILTFWRQSQPSLDPLSVLLSHSDVQLATATSERRAVRA
jgi:hypothetical protein